MPCGRCGHINPDENYFCGHCGIPLRHPHGFEPEATPFSSPPGTEVPDPNLGFFSPPQTDNADPFGLMEDVPPPAQSVFPEGHSTTPRRVALSPDEPGRAESLRTGSPASTSAHMHSPQQAELPRSAISAPSILGLDEVAVENRGLDYLYDEEPRRSYGRGLVAILLLAAFGVFLAYEWKQFPSWYSTIVNPQSNQPVQQAQVKNPPSAPEPAAPANAQPPAAETEQGMANGANSERHAAEVPANTVAPAPPVENGPSDSARKPAENEHPIAQQPAAVPDQGTGKTPDRASSSQHKPLVAPGSDHTGTQPALEPDTNERSPLSPDPEPSASAVHERSRAYRGEVRSTRDSGDQLAARGQAYLYGNGVPRNCSQALVYLRKGADLGNATARSQLGAMYATGHCVPLDRARAYQWFSLALEATNGRNVWIERNREMIWSKMTDAEKAQTRQAAY